MRRRPLLVAASLVLVTLALLAAPASAGAAPRAAAGPEVGANVAVSAMATAVAGQEPDAPADDGTGGSSDDDSDEPLPGDDIIPLPNSGRAPEEAGDRGGALQILVFVLIVAGVGGIVTMIVRESRRNRAARQT
jgi:hypothetical protein